MFEAKEVVLPATVLGIRHQQVAQALGLKNHTRLHCRPLPKFTDGM